MKNSILILIMSIGLGAFSQTHPYDFPSDMPHYDGGRTPYSISWIDSDGTGRESFIYHWQMPWTKIIDGPRIECFTGETDSSGNYQVTFVTSFSQIPFVAAAIQSQSVNQFVRVSSVSETGFTVNAYGFDTLGNALQIDTTPLQSITLSVFVIQK